MKGLAKPENSNVNFNTLLCLVPDLSFLVRALERLGLKINLTSYLGLKGQIRTQVYFRKSKAYRTRVHFSGSLILNFRISCKAVGILGYTDQAKMYLETLGTATSHLHLITGAIRIKCLSYNICIFPLAMNFKAKRCKLIFQKGPCISLYHSVCLWNTLSLICSSVLATKSIAS